MKNEWIKGTESIHFCGNFAEISHILWLNLRSTLMSGASHQLTVLVADAIMLPSWMTILITQNLMYFVPKTRLSKPIRTLQPGHKLSMACTSNACIPIMVLSSLVMNSLIIFNNKGLSAVLPWLILLNIMELLSPLTATCLSAHMWCYTSLSCPGTCGPKPSTLPSGSKIAPLLRH